jgi:uncharacterized protein
MARFRLIPHEEQFFRDFVSLAEEIRSGAYALRQMLSVNPIAMSQVAVIKDIEHRCDKATHGIIDRLNRTFVTPLDREDIHELAVNMDDVMDAIDAAAAVFKLYKVEEARTGARRLAEIVADATDLLVEAMNRLERREGVIEMTARLNQLEKEADRVHQDAIVSLFEDQKHDPIAVIKWKEILDFLEAATDRCDDVANLLQGVVVKHG